MKAVSSSLSLQYRILEAPVRYREAQEKLGKQVDPGKDVYKEACDELCEEV